MVNKDRKRSAEYRPSWLSLGNRNVRSVRLKHPCKASKRVAREHLATQTAAEAPAERWRKRGPGWANKKTRPTDMADKTQARDNAFSPDEEFIMICQRPVGTKPRKRRKLTTAEVRQMLFNLARLLHGRPPRLRLKK
jgi:hypothetical protein